MNLYRRSMFVSVAPATLWNDQDKNPLIGLSERNLRVTRLAGAGTWAAVRATRPQTRGKFYFETTHDLAGDVVLVGIGVASASLVTGTYAGSEPTSIGAGWGGSLYSGGLNYTNDVEPVSPTFGIAVDLDARLFWYRNLAAPNVWSGNGGSETGDPATGAFGLPFPSGIEAGAPVFPMLSAGAVGASTKTNFGGEPFAAPSPTGFRPWFG